jgi:hypothetical protein
VLAPHCTIAQIDHPLANGAREVSIAAEDFENGIRVRVRGDWGGCEKDRALGQQADRRLDVATRDGRRLLTRQLEDLLVCCHDCLSR